ncbi:hypothetical protein [Rhizobium sp. YK2]|uniref:hypothetical protein n=1 Tax=Rhizobium sp. YK2 TaxID=1860096 RepID=UPI00084CC761|nr:hypothetical protein [Rhizobium sp. YK2]OEC96696.1 hypothetical protein A9Z06_29090 [Rhizobium sp. YK2]
MKDAFIKIRISEADKSRLVKFAGQSGKSASNIVRSALNETMRGQIAGDKRRKDIAALRRSTNSMIEAFAEKPIDVPKLREIAVQVRQDALRVLT